MLNREGSALALIDQIRRKAPAYLDLLTAPNDDEFEKAFDSILEKAITGLETNAKNFEALNEVGLTACLIMGLSIPGLTVTAETHSNGHVDLTVNADHCVPARKKLGEAKIYDGPEYHFKGLEQLLKRYSTGRDARGLMIVYFQKKDIAGLVKKLRQRMDNDKPCSQQGYTADHQLKWSFLTSHTHSSGENLKVSHIGCNIFIDTKP